MVYIDFDGVILDTEEQLFKEWRKNPNRHLLPSIEKIKYIQNEDWNYILNNSEVMNDSIYYLKEMDPNKSAILTKVHSLENEAFAKIEWIRKNDIKQNIFFVPYNKKKSDVVLAQDNILIDDCLKNLDEWVHNNGNGIFFDYNNDGYDSWDKPNIKSYPSINNLSKFTKNRLKEERIWKKR